MSPFIHFACIIIRVALGSEHKEPGRTHNSTRLFSDHPFVTFCWPKTCIKIVHNDTIHWTIFVHGRQRLKTLGSHGRRAQWTKRPKTACPSLGPTMVMFNIQKVKNEYILWEKGENGHILSSRGHKSAHGVDTFCPVKVVTYKGCKDQFHWPILGCGGADEFWNWILGYCVNLLTKLLHTASPFKKQNWIV